MKIYNKETVKELISQNNQELLSVLDYFVPMMENEIQDYIFNIHGEILLLKFDDKIIPIFKADKNYNDSVYTSLFSHYVQYIVNELKNTKNPIRHLFEFAGMYFKKNNINKVLYINEWLISTNFHPNFGQVEIDEIIKFLTKHFPDYAIIFRNLNKVCNYDLIETLKICGFKSLISKQIFILNNNRLKTLTKKYRGKLRKDSKFKNNFSLKSEKNMTQEDFSKIHELYKKLYFEKYTDLNPDYTEKYFELANNSNSFEFDLYEYNKQVCAFTMYHKSNQQMSTSAIGYDLNLPCNIGLYRFIIYDLISKIGKHCEIFNMGAGVGNFKKQRGALPYFEYNAIYYKHLSLNRKIMFKFLELIINISIPFCCKYRLGGFISQQN